MISGSGDNTKNKMLKIRALNRDSLSDEDAPTIRKEAQEEIALDLYNSALRLQCNEKLDEAKDILQKLLDVNIPQLENQGGLPKTMSTLKYSCYVNLGSIEKQNGDPEKALDNYLLASDLDQTDVTLWYKIGILALELDRFRKAACAFSKGLECSESHWPCLDRLISLLFAIRDNVACLMYITKALALDPDYTKGLVLRKEIYKNNPATRDYYKLYNPDYILEPDLDVSIDETEEKQYLADVQKLCDRINEVEKSLGPKPLPCLPLPRALEEFTWVAVGRILTDLHKHISDNNLSHFCKIDFTKSMNQTRTVDKIVMLDVVAATNSKEDIEEVVGAEVVTTVVVEPKEAEQTEERRMSVTSENNCDVNDSGVENINSSQAEDNDEMDQDTEDQDENLEQKNDKKRNTKRRRDLVSELEIWGWHSKRKSAKKAKFEKDLSIKDALRRIISPHLLLNQIQLSNPHNMEDSMNTMDIYQLAITDQANNAYLSTMNTNKEEYFDSQRERDDVKKYWTKARECCDTVTLIEEYVHTLASFWHIKWPPELVPIYIEAYTMYREHFEHPPLFHSEIIFEDLRNDALATILYGELCLYQTNLRERKMEDVVHPVSFGHLQLISGWEEKWLEEYKSFFVRVNWFRAHIFRKISDNTLAINSLHLIQEVVTEEEEKSGTKFFVHFPNCDKYPYVSSEVVDKLLKHLEMIDSLSRLEQLYYSQNYAEVAEILQTTFSCIGTPPTYGKMGRPAQLGMLMDSLWFISKVDCFIWTEMCLYETVGHFIKPLKDKQKWEMVLNKCLTILYEIIKEETVSVVDSLSEEQRSRIIESLCRIVCHQLNADGGFGIPLGTITAWIVMHYILLREEHREQARKVTSHVRKKRKGNNILENENQQLQRDVPASIAVLFSAHEFLGPKGWCLTSQGELLHFIIDQILDRLDTPIFEHLRDKIDIHLEQAFFCLYQHPSKKNKVSRHLADHNVNPLPLQWERAQQLYEFYCPDALPEFDSYKSISISSDLEQLLQRVIALVPTRCDSQPTIQKISEYLNGDVTELPPQIEFPPKVRAIYYLLGDYYFKQNEVTRSIKYFLLDLSINPMRLDTWADLALGYASQLESKLNHCERFKNETEFLDKAKSARICFRQALKLANDHVTLWIEFGSFEYMVHSFCSRVLKFESDTFSMEKFEILENQKENYLDSSGISFTKALDLYQSDQTEADERWLHHYMLGKVAEKRRKEPVDYLQHYLTAAALLNENNATYPDKIHHNNPQHLSVEALEIHYRIHASILKFLELHEGKSILSTTGKMFRKCLDTSKLYETSPKLLLPKSEQEVDNDTKNNNPEVAKCVEDLLTEVENKEGVQVELNPPKDIITLSDTDDEKAIPKSTVLESTVLKMKERDVQDIMDAMMRETMAKQQHQPTDTDSDGEIKLPISTDKDKTVVTDDKAKEIEEMMEAKKKADSVSVTSSIRKSVDETTTTSSTSSDSSSSDSDSDDSSSSSSSTSTDTPSGNLSDSEVNNLIDRCIMGLEKCVVRLPQNYKAFYRLVHLYFHYTTRKDLSKCRQLLLGEYKCKSGYSVNGLFADRRNYNFFNGVWRIPSSEIDRPGSLAAHMIRCVTILLQVLCHTNDYKMLLDVSLQLKRFPDPDKIYIRHAEREQLSEQALSLCIQSLRTQIKNTNTSGAMQKLLLDVYRSYQRVQKHTPSKEAIFAVMLADIYKKYMKDQLPENVNVLDLALKFCQQHKAIEKLKQQQSKQPVVTPAAAPPAPPPPPPPPPLVTGVPPVLPTPSTVTASATTTSPLLKRPSLGRPRGRPPGPKQPSVNRLPRGRSPLGADSLAWQNLLYDPKAISYMLQYQEELLRQYNSLNQITHMANFTNQFAQPSTSQVPLLNASQIMQTFSQMTNAGLNPLGMSQLNQGLNRLNPSLFKKVAQKSSPAVTQSAAGSSWMPSDDVFKQMCSSMGSTLKSSPLKSTTLSKCIPKSSTSQTKPTYTTAKVTKNLQPSTYKYATTDVPKSKPRDMPVKPVISNTTTIEIPKKTQPKFSAAHRDYVSASAILNDRPSITITPVTQTVPPVKLQNSQPVATHVGKTLQEKLADKQKQHTINKFSSEGKSGDKGKSQVISSVFSSTPSSIPHVNLPTFPLDSGISISQLPIPKISQAVDSSSLPMSFTNQQSTPTKITTTVSTDSSSHINLPPNMPLSVSVIKKPEDTKKKKSLPTKDEDDDDVIIIE